EIHPLKQGLAELVAYLNIATQRKHTVIDDSVTEELVFNKEHSTATEHELLKLSKRVAQIPKIIFSR
ncbi:MAG: DUF3375 domain-containing protein, partial [Aquificaceae bacterium]